MQTKRWASIKIIIFIFLVLVIIAMLAWAGYNYGKYIYKLEQMKSYDMNLQVSDYAGFNLTSDSLNFGTTVPTGGANRFIDIETDRPTRVMIVLEGDLGKWVTPSENNFIFNGTKRIEFDASVPWNARPGNYTGKAYILFKKP